MDKATIPQKEVKSYCSGFFFFYFDNSRLLMYKIFLNLELATDY